MGRRYSMARNHIADDKEKAMSRYIDAEALKETHYNFATGELVPLAWADIENAPAIDIVRCKECRHWCCHNDVDYDQSKFTYYCEVHGISLEGDEFCSYGEREGER